MLREEVHAALGLAQDADQHARLSGAWASGARFASIWSLSATKSSATSSWKCWLWQPSSDAMSRWNRWQAHCAWRIEEMLHLSWLKNWRDGFRYY